MTDLEHKKSVFNREIQSGVIEDSIKEAEEWAADLVKGKDTRLSTTQLRKYFGEVKRLELLVKRDGFSEHITEVRLLIPKLAYAVGRTTKDSSKRFKIEDFYTVISGLITEVKDERNFNNFIRIFEIIVAFHKKAEHEAERDKNNRS